MEDLEKIQEIENARILDKYERLFAEEAWKDLVEDIKERCENYKQSLVMNPSGERDLYFVKGYVSAMGYIIELENMIAQARNQSALEQEAMSSLPG